MKERVTVKKSPSKKKRSIKRWARAGIAALATFGLITFGPVGEANAARQHSFLHGLSSERSSMLVFYKWDCTDGRMSDFVPRGNYAQIDVGCIWVPAGYSLWLDTRPGPGTSWTRWARAYNTRSRGVSMASMPVTRSQFVFRKGNNWGQG